MRDNWLIPQPLHKAVADRAMVLADDMVVAPNIEFGVNDQSKAVNLNMRRMETHNDLDIKPARAK